MLEGNGLQQGLDDVKSKLLLTLCVNYAIWIPLNLFNFGCIPVRNQVLFIGLGSMLYNTCLSYIHNTCDSQSLAVSPGTTTLNY